MNITTTQELNQLPRKTNRWLKVNDVRLRTNVTKEIRPYQNSCLILVPEGLTVMDIAKAKAQIPKINTVLASPVEPYQGVETALLATALTEHNAGLFVHTKRNQTVNTPLRVEYVLDANNEIVNDYNVVVAEENSQLTVVFDYTTNDDVAGVHNGLLDIYAKSGANVTIVTIQRLNRYSHHFDSHVAYVADGAQVNSIQIELGGTASITNYSYNLGQNSSGNIATVYYGDEDQLIDINYVMNHYGRHSKSDIVVKGALNDHAEKTFKGTLDFKRGAAKSIGSEQEYVVLLDKAARSKAVPLLLCTEDDVQGMHAASVGKVDQAQLFYMMSRGFSKKDATKMIVEAIFNPVIEEIPLPELQDEIKAEIQRRLGNE